MQENNLLPTQQMLTAGAEAIRKRLVTEPATYQGLAEACWQAMLKVVAVPHAATEPVTAEMVVAGANAHHGIEGGTAGGAIACYKAMRAVAPVSPADAQVRQLQEYIKAMDAVIDDEGVARSCINPLEDLKRAIRALKSRAPDAQVWRDAIKAARDEIDLLATWSPEPTLAYQRDCVQPSIRKALKHLDAVLRSLPPPAAQEGTI